MEGQRLMPICKPADENGRDSAQDIDGHDEELSFPCLAAEDPRQPCSR